MTTERLYLLCRAVQGASRALIVTHNDPDPDAIASAVALKHLLSEVAGVGAEIAYRGIIGRAENRALVRYLDHPLKRLASADLREETAIALVDTQPSAGNNPLPGNSTAKLVLDHHPLLEETASAEFADVRPEIGATSTMLTEYLQAAAIEPSKRLATALFYGIKTDTMGLVRGASPADVSAYFDLQARIDVDALLEIERAQVPAAYFQQLDTTLHAARIYGQVVVSYIGSMKYPDLAAEMADLLMRLRGASWVVCMGESRNRMIVAVRNRSRRGDAGRLIQDIMGENGTAGGHGAYAGGYIPLGEKPPEMIARQVRQRVLEALKIPPESTGKPIIK